MNTPTIESLKEVWRWFVSYVLAQLFVSLIDLLTKALPFFPVTIFPATIVIFGFSLPLRLFISQLVLPAIARGLDKYKYAKSKEKVYGDGDKNNLGLPIFNLFNSL